MDFYNCILIGIAVSIFRNADCDSTKKSTNMQNAAPIKYPGPIQEVSNRYGTEDEVLDVPKDCRNNTFCTIKPKNYPQDKINQMFKGNKNADQPSLIHDDILDNRQGDDSQDDCEIHVTYEPLYQVKSDVGDWRTVLQAPDENYVQRVRLEQCVNPSASCFNAFLADPEIEVFCKQKFNTWEVLVAPKNGRLKPEKIKATLPVCCSCAYRYKGSLQNRLGGKGSKRNVTKT